MIVAGDLTASYANENGQSAVDRHFDDVMAWSQTSAYMPAWGNHEWDEPDDLRNYKGRFAIPHADDDVACGAGSVIDSYTIPRPR